MIANDASSRQVSWNYLLECRHMIGSGRVPSVNLQTDGTNSVAARLKLQYYLSAMFATAIVVNAIAQADVFP